MNKQQIKWEENFKDVKKYVEENDKYPVQNHDDENITFLGRWVSVQRKKYKQKNLSDYRIECLKSLRGWEWEVDYEKRWKDILKKVKRYVKKHKDFPDYSAGGEEGKLGRWVQTQNQRYKNNNLVEQRVEALEKISGWCWGMSLEERWQFNFDKLKKYVNRNGSFPPYCIKGEGYTLRVWISTQKESYKNDKLSDSKVKKLEKIDCWSWILVKEETVF